MTHVICPHATAWLYISLTRRKVSEFPLTVETEFHSILCFRVQAFMSSLNYTVSRNRYNTNSAHGAYKSIWSRGKVRLSAPAVK